MNLIGRHIEYLVRYNDCVVVPGWGAFISRYQPALLGKDGKFLPPTRSLSFNQSLTHDDGLLASSIVRKSKVSYDAAMKQIANEVAVMRHQLTQNGEIAISNIGVFRQNGEGAIIFDPFINTSATLSFSNLPKIDIRPIKVTYTPEKQSNENKKDTIYLPIRRSWARVAASIAVILGLGFVFSTPIINNGSYQASLSAPKVSTPQPVEIKLNEPSVDAQLVLDVTSIDESESMEVVDTTLRNQYQEAVANYKHKKGGRSARKRLMMEQIEKYRKLKEAEEISTEATSSNTIVLKNNESDKYCLVIASLPSKEHAEEYISKSNNSQLSILEKDGRYRVYATTGASSKEVLSIARKSGLMKHYPNAWVCRK